MVGGARLSSMTDRSERSPLIGHRDADGYYLFRREQNNARSAALRRRLRELGLLVWAILATCALVVLAIWASRALKSDHGSGHGHKGKQPGGDGHNSSKRNLIFMVSDGMGPASLSLTRSFRQHLYELPINDTLYLDRHFHGTSRTRSSNSLVTDSAAGATAFSCGRKTYNTAIAIDPDYNPCGTVMEAAKRAGWLTGLVVTTDITDATPAAFSAHAYTRWLQDDIATQQVGLTHPLGERVVDLMLGGGRCHFMANSTEGSCRMDNEDVVSRAVKEQSWTFLDDRKSFDKLQKDSKVDLPIMGLFAGSDIPFEIDRRGMHGKYPSLSEMTSAALRVLDHASRKNRQGFFLMVEGSRIDHAGHINDPAAQVHEVLEYDKTFKAVLDFIKESDTETIVISTSDHETGGLSTALQKPNEGPIYSWNPSILARANHSAEYLANELHRHIKETRYHPDGNPIEVLKLMVWINENLIAPGLGIEDARTSELEALVATPEAAITLFANMVSERALIGWATHGHSAVDVNIYSSGGERVEPLHYNVENTDIGNFLEKYLDVDLGPITKELKEKWTKDNVRENVDTNGFDQELRNMEHWARHNELW